VPYRTSLAIVLLLGIAGSARAEPPASAAPSRPRFYVGVCTHFGQSKGAGELNLAQMKAAGINSLRDELGWGGVERTRGEYAVDADKDATLRRASAMGIHPMLIFDYANRLYDNGDRPRSPEALEGYTRYAEFLARHYGPDVHLYEVWNEYDIPIGMPEPYRQGGSPADYVKMLKHLYPRLKKAAPHAVVLGGAATPEGVHRGWIEEMVKLGGLDCCDAVSIHTYNYGAGGEDRMPEAWRGSIERVENMLRRYSQGKDVPLMVTEMGWPTHVGKGGGTPPELSASYLGRMYLLARTLPYLRGVWWYDYQDDGWDAAYNECNFGIVRPDLTPKPAYYVMAGVSDPASRGEYLGRVETEDPKLWILRFRLDGKELWAAWSGDDRLRQLLLQTDSPGRPLVTDELGRPPVERGWGYRSWAFKGGGALFVPNQLAMVVADRPCLLRGKMEDVRLVCATDKLGAVAEKAGVPPK